MTVKELAKRCGVHYNTMRKWLLDNNVRKSNTTRNAQFLLTDDVIEKAENNFLKNKQKETQNINNIDDILLHQIKQKDLQLLAQQDQIMHLQKLLENQQVLTLQSQEKIQLLENDKHETKRKSFLSKLLNR